MKTVEEIWTSTFLNKFVHCGNSAQAHRVGHPMQLTNWPETSLCGRVRHSLDVSRIIKSSVLDVVKPGTAASCWLAAGCWPSCPRRRVGGKCTRQWHGTVVKTDSGYSRAENPFLQIIYPKSPFRVKGVSVASASSWQRPLLINFGPGQLSTISSRKYDTIDMLL